jgi:Family of unknown function (DUF6961)
MIPDIDIWRAAALMIKHYGDTADIEAAAKADALLAEGDTEGQRIWMQIARAIDELRTVKPGEARN